VFVKVGKIEKSGSHHTYDLTVSDNHSFFCNGMAVHNTSAKDPAVQTIPKHTTWAKRIRECLVAPPGYKMFQVDFSQGELKITACVANEEQMLDAYSRGVDLHCLTGSKLAGISLDDFMELKYSDPTKFARYRTYAKPANFGLIYGMQAGGYRSYSKSNYGIEMTMLEAEEHRNNFFDLYPGLVTWHDNSIAFARAHQYIRSPLGRMRHLPLIKSKDFEIRSRNERQAINSPIQSTLSDLCLWAISIVENKYKGKDVQMIGMTHDSIYGYVREDKAVELVRDIAHIMSDLPIKRVFKWNHQIDFTVDAEIGTNLSDLQEIEL